MSTRKRGRERLRAGRCGQGAGSGHHQRDLLSEVDIIEGQPGEFTPTHPGIEQQADDGGVAPGLEGGARTCVQDRLDLRLTQDRRWLLGDDRRAHPLHRRGRDFVLALRPAEERLQAPVGERDGRRPLAGILEGDDQRLDVLASDRPQRSRHAALGEEAVEPLKCGEVGLDRRRALVRRPQAEPVAVDRGADRQPGCAGARVDYD